MTSHADSIFQDDFESTQLPAKLAERLQRNTLTQVDWRSFAPQLAYGRHSGPAPATAREAAVLVLLYLRAGAWHVPLMLRPDHMVAHAAQVSFPGGLIELDETPEECAVREFTEELGATPQQLEHLGRLSPIYIFGSNFHVTPCVAVTRHPLRFSPNPAEVAELLEIPVDHLHDPTSFDRHSRTRYGVSYEAPHFDFQSHRIWGATCLILGELQQRLRPTASPLKLNF